MPYIWDNNWLIWLDWLVCTMYLILSYPCAGLQAFLIRHPCTSNNGLLPQPAQLSAPVWTPHHIWEVLYLGFLNIWPNKQHICHIRNVWRRKLDCRHTKYLCACFRRKTMCLNFKKIILISSRYVSYLNKVILPP